MSAGAKMTGWARHLGGKGIKVVLGPWDNVKPGMEQHRAPSISPYVVSGGERLLVSTRLRQRGRPNGSTNRNTCPGVRLFSISILPFPTNTSVVTDGFLIVPSFQQLSNHTQIDLSELEARSKSRTSIRINGSDGFLI